ncbi:ABC transporter ATP-binding protein [uncultured Flavobacterium sp.]|uniref:ABC transporter ATP-binding protein n=1 Tax=uncultured Flavobacterium sp. TaxID=165435 RepID=UPI0030ED6E60|tara:strand:+ start:43091 stop:43870 length:780 start_codon:yes stop_codon:yes gene_type:complete
MNKKVLHTTNLTIGYTSKSNTTTIAKNLNINLSSGKLIGLIGANGIGKSTLLKTITGIIKPLEGSVFINDKLIETFKPEDLAKELSIVLTEHLPPSNLTVYEIVALGRQPYTNWLGTLSNDDKLKIDEAIALTEIDSFQHKKHYEISDGQLQKTLIARALAQDTDLIILDEPTTHLDLVHKVTLLKLLQKLTHETGKTILYSTHDIDLAIQLCNEMIVITENEIFQNQPCNLIEDGVFNTIFKNENIQFDAFHGKFNIK